MRLGIHFILWFLLMGLTTSVAAQSRKFHFSGNKMGSPLNLIFVDKDSIHADQIAQAAFRLVDSLVAIYSDYDSTSELSRLCNLAGSGPVKVSPGLLDILVKSKAAYELSKHSFDISIGPLSQLWRKARKSHQFPDSSQVKTTKILVGMDQLLIDQTHSTVSLLKKGMQLDLGGIAKGYVAEKVLLDLKKGNRYCACRCWG